MADFDESRSMVFKNDGNDEYFDESRKIQTNLTLTVAKNDRLTPNSKGHSYPQTCIMKYITGIHTLIINIALALNRIPD